MSSAPGHDKVTSAQLVKVVALDGPAGSGKSTVARSVARALGWRFVDTGATYRAATVAVLRAGADVGDPVAVLQVARSAHIELSTDPDANVVLLDGEDITSEIRSAKVSATVSAVSAVPQVRQLLIEVQRAAMGTAGAVVEGRDIATVVAPHAAVKVFLDADPEVRARRRAGEVTQSTVEAEAIEAAVALALRTRDLLDNQTNKLEASDGAVHVDTTLLSIDQVTEVVVRLALAAGVAIRPVDL